MFKEAVVIKPEGSEPIYSSDSPALSLVIHSHLKCARGATLHLPHGPIRTPVFMPVGTKVIIIQSLVLLLMEWWLLYYLKGTIKGLSSAQLYENALCPEIILGNTYHLALQPGTDIIDGLVFQFNIW